MTAPLTPAELAELERAVDATPLFSTRDKLRRLIAEVRATRELLSESLWALERVDVGGSDIISVMESRRIARAVQSVRAALTARARAGRDGGEQ